MSNEKIRFSVEISVEANQRLESDAEANIRSRKGQAEFILEQHYGTGTKTEEEREPEHALSR